HRHRTRNRSNQCRQRPRPSRSAPNTLALGPSNASCGPIPSDLSAGEHEMSDAAGRADRLDVEALLEPFETVPEAFPASENDGHDRDVHMVDHVGREELAD